LIDYYKERSPYFRQVGGYSTEDLVEKYKRDSLKITKKWHELNQLSGNAKKFNLMDFWSRFILLEYLEQILNKREPTKKEIERIQEALYYFHFIEPRINNFIKEEKENGRTRKTNISFFGRVVNRLFN
jgi:hypothetical protein